MHLHSWSTGYLAPLHSSPANGLIGQNCWKYSSQVVCVCAFHCFFTRVWESLVLHNCLNNSIRICCLAHSHLLFIRVTKPRYRNTDKRQKQQHVMTAPPPQPLQKKTMLSLMIAALTKFSQWEEWREEEEIVRKRKCSSYMHLAGMTLKLKIIPTCM